MANEYMEQLDWDDPKTASMIVSELKRVLLKELRDELKFDKTYVAKVVAVGTGTADIKFEDGVNTITGVKNKSGEVLNIGDTIYIEAINNSLTNIVIKYKK